MRPHSEAWRVALTGPIRPGFRCCFAIGAIEGATLRKPLKRVGSRDRVVYV